MVDVSGSLRRLTAAIWGFIHPEHRLEAAWRRHDENQQRVDAIRLRSERKGYE